jgi:hypothetical protein
MNLNERTDFYIIRTLRMTFMDTDEFDEILIFLKNKKDFSFFHPEYSDINYINIMAEHEGISVELLKYALDNGGKTVLLKKENKITINDLNKLKLLRDNYPEFNIENVYSENKNCIEYTSFYKNRQKTDTFFN